MEEDVNQIWKSCNLSSKSYQHIAKTEQHNDCGDYSQDTSKYNYRNLKKTRGIDNFKLQDLASGDHTKANKAQKTNGDNLSTSNINVHKTTKVCSTDKKLPLETTVEFKNKNYDDSKSSVDASVSSLIRNKLLKTDKTESEKSLQYRIATARPVFCPVSNCAKLVAIDSITSHFYFDHSKVPRIALEYPRAEPQDFYLKANNISSETECVALFLRKLNRRSSHTSQNIDCSSLVNNLNKNNKLLLLMSAKFQISGVNVCQRDNGKPTLKRNTYVQTNMMNSEYKKISKTPPKQCGKAFQVNINKLDCDEMLLVWLCTLDEEEKTYTIVVTTEDHRLSYGYTGAAIHIRDKQDPLSIYERPECLIVRGKVLNKLLDNENNIRIIVNCID